MKGPAVLDAASPAADVIRWGGGKAANLHRLSAAGPEVPRWVVIGTGVLAGHREATGLGRVIDEALAGLSADTAEDVAAVIRKAFDESDLDDATRSAIAAACTAVGGPAAGGRALAVRSSAAGEDSARHSFAGQYDSFLNVQGFDEVLARVRDCWASAYSARSLTYRWLHDLPVQPIEMAVVLQQIVPARTSGVLFTADPLTGRDETVISAVYGLGEGLVSGAVDADTITVDRSGRVISSIVGEKREEVVAAAGAGCRTVAVEPARQQVLALGPEQVDLLRRAGERIEALDGVPQDIEWAFAGDTLYLLQSRPITTFPGRVGIRAEVRVWDNSNIIESYGEITSPLTFSFARDVYGRLYREYCTLLGVPRSQLKLMDEGFFSMLGHFDGRVYYNVLNWTKVIGLLPVYPLNRRILAAAMGVAQTPIEDENRPRSLEYDSHLLTTLVRTRIGLKFGWYCLTVKSSVDRFITAFDGTYRTFDGLDYDAMPPAEVYRQYTVLERTLLAQWGRMAVLDNVIMLSYGVLYTLTGRWLPQAPEWFLWQVVKVGDDVESTRPARRLTELAGQVLARPELVDLVRTLPADQVQARLEADAGPDTDWLRTEIDSYIREFGYRSANELKLEEPDLFQDPTILMSMLRDAVEAAGRTGGSEANGPGAPGAEDADAYLDRHLRGPRRWVYERARGSVRTALRERERVRFARTRAFGMARRVFTAMGAGLAEAGALNDPRDVFHLRLEELRGAFNGTISHRELRPLAVLRRTQQEKQRLLPAPPPRFVTVGGPYWGERRADLPVPAEPDPGSENVLRGTPSSPGVAAGEARVLTEPRDAGAGIVVTYRTDPGWIGVLSSASALLIERGSPLTHVAIVARELGVPTVVQIPGLTARVRTGMQLTVDGASGTVTIDPDTTDPVTTDPVTIDIPAEAR